jgi:Predicted DNA modification methylase
MSTRNSGYARVPADLYQTPAWVTESLGEHVILAGRTVWDPACGEGKMVRALEALGARVIGSDLHDHGYGPMIAEMDFLSPQAGRFAAQRVYQDIITNPPYGQRGATAERFIEVGLSLLPLGGILALLLQADFDSAKTRRHLFGECPHFAGRIVLNRRIEWFPREIKADGTKASGPSANHSWFVWQKRVLRPAAPPFTVYAPEVRG